MKKRYKRKNVKNALLLVIILLAVATALIFAVQQSQITYTPNVDKTIFTLVDSDNEGATYNGKWVSAGDSPDLACGDLCSYDFIIQQNQASSLLTDVEGLVQNEWFEGTVTQKPSLTMIKNYASDLAQESPATIKNAKIYCRISGKDILTCRYTGDIEAQSGMGGYVYGDFSGSGIVTIPKESYYNTWLEQRQEEEIITEQEIEAELQDPVIEQVAEPDLNDFIDTSIDETAPTQQDVRNTNILLVVFLAVIGILGLIYVLVLLGSRKK